MVYSVSDVSEIFQVSEETVRRWIRDGSLPAQRNLGRGGNAIYLDAIIDFANNASQKYQKLAEAWLVANDIPYKRIDNPLLQDAASTIAHKTAIGFAIGGPIGMTLAPLKKMREYSEMSKYHIKLPQDPDHMSDEAELPKATSDTHVAPQADSSYSTEEQTNSELQKKIIDEKLKLLQLRQELAKITAEISICEDQIKYYELLSKK